MGRCDNENVMVEKDRMGLVQALIVLHTLRDMVADDHIREAFNVVFEWIDNAVLLFKKFGDRHE